MTPRLFRGLILAHVAALSLSIALSVFDHGVPPGLVAAQLESVPGWLLDESALVLSLLLIAVAAVIAGYLGLFFFKPWGRAVALWTTIIGCLLTPALGPSLSGGLSAAFYDAANLLWGAVLALTYLSPVAQRFRGASPRQAL